MKRSWKKILFFSLILILLVIVWFIYFSEFSKIDNCLDRGGAWNENFKSCEYE